MTERKLLIIFTFLVVLLLIFLSGVLIFFERGGAAKFDVFGQKFNSTNIGLAVLFLALVFFGILVKYIFGGTKADYHRSIYSSSNHGDKITWEQVAHGVDELVSQLNAADGFRPDLVIGICGGGLLVADFIAKRLGHIPCLSIWPNRHNSHEKSRFDGEASSINRVNFDQLIDENRIRRILLVDDVVYSGTTLKHGMEYLAKSSQAVASGKTEVKTAAIFALVNSSTRPDFFHLIGKGDKKPMPVSSRIKRG